jgi:multisubunit Na+/H+ antiporter MnhE subunit
MIIGLIVAVVAAIYVMRFLRKKLHIKNKRFLWWAGKKTFKVVK